MRILFSLTFWALPILLLGQKPNKAMAISSKQLIQTIIEQTGAKPVPNTVDTIKEGNSDRPVKGIVTCMFATMEVLKKAVKKNCNLIITHEPLYYNHLDTTTRFQKDSVFLEKQQFIVDNKLVVWRFHDYIHRIQPDAMLTGMVRKFGWEKYQVEEHLYEFTFPKMTLADLLLNIKKTFPENALQVIGNLEMEVTNVQFAPGASGSDRHIKILNDSRADVVIAGEVSQWETYEYVRDAVSQGRNKAIVFIGHINSEESGMEYCAEWLGEFIKDIPISFVPCGSSYWTY